MRNMRTKVSFNTSKSHSLKSTIPEGVAEALKLEAGCFVEWSIEVKDGKMVAVVSKVSDWDKISPDKLKA